MRSVRASALMLLACYVLPLGMWGCTGIVTYIKSDTRNDNIQCEPDTSQIKFGKRSCIIIQQGKTTNGGPTTKAAVPTLAIPASSAGGAHGQ